MLRSSQKWGNKVEVKIEREGIVIQWQNTINGEEKQRLKTKPISLNINYNKQTQTTDLAVPKADRWSYWWK